MSKKHHSHKQDFFKSHADTFAIMALNLAIASLLIAMIISNSHRIDAANARSDLLHQTIHEEIKAFHGRLCAIEEINKK